MRFPLQPVAWYQWGLLVALLVALFSVFWVFFDSRRRSLDVLVWRVLALVGVFLILPSAVVALINWIDPTVLGSGARSIVAPLAWLGIAGGLMTLVAFIGYLIVASTGSVSHPCPNCGAPLDPSWDYCPYCKPEVDTQVAPGPDYPIPELPPISPTLPVEGDVGLEPDFPEPGPGPEPTMFITKVKPQLAWLVQCSGTRAGTPFRLREVTDIGRDAEDNDLVIDETRVSRKHARIRLIEGEFVLQDLAAINKTFVNGEEILKVTLKDGDRIAFADVEFRFMEVKTKEA